jgi:hypothetical protein
VKQCGEMSTKPADSPAPERYAALALQIATACVNDCPDRAAARDLMAASLARVGASVAASKGLSGSSRHRSEARRCQYFLTGFRWANRPGLGQGGPAIDGPEYQALADVPQCQALAGNTYEVDPPEISRPASSSRRAETVLRPADLPPTVALRRGTGT